MLMGMLNFAICLQLFKPTLGKRRIVKLSGDRVVPTTPRTIGYRSCVDLSWIITECGFSCGDGKCAASRTAIFCHPRLQAETVQFLVG